MSALMIRMAQRASEDNSLMASLISRYGETKGLHWEEIAAQLWVDDLKLAKLALCRRPGRSRFPEDVTQIADFVGIDKQKLINFIQAAESAQLAQIVREHEVMQRRTVSPVRRFASALQAAMQRRDVFSTRRLAFAFAVVALFLVLLSSLIFQPSEDVGATLAVTDGQATITQVDKLFYVVPRQTKRIALVGETIAVKAGDTIVVGKGAAAQLRLLDGSTVDLLEVTKLEIDDLFITQGAYKVRLGMQTGSTVNHVLRRLEVGDVFEIITPSSKVSVRGTIFAVEVLSQKQTYVACNEGVVSLKMGSDSVELHAGEEVYAYVGQPLRVQPIGSGAPQIPDYPTASPTEKPAIQDPSADGAPEGESGVPVEGESGAPVEGESGVPGEGESGVPDEGESGVPSDGESGVPGEREPKEPPPDDTSPSEQDTPKEVPGKPPGKPGKPVGGGEPPGQAKKDSKK